MTEPSPPLEPQPRQTSGFLLIVILLGIFFLIVLVVAILLLPDKGRKLLKLSEANPVTHTLASVSEPRAPHHHPSHC